MIRETVMSIKWLLDAALKAKPAKHRQSRWIDSSSAFISVHLRPLNLA
jgi:hypothetical protein